MEMAAAGTALQKLIGRLSKEHPTDLIRGAMIRHWAAVNNVNPARLEGGTATGEFLGLTSGDFGAVDHIIKQLGEALPAISIKELERGFESLIGAERRRSQGVVYTPNFIIDYLIRNGIAMGMRDRSSPPLICDPFCGSAGFLIRAAEILRDEYGVPLQKAFSDCIAGFDKDAWAIQHARCLIELSLAYHGIDPGELKLRLFVRDTLLAKPEELWTASGFVDGFNVIATNPPYVKLQNINPEYRDQLSSRYPEFVTGSFSLSLLFLVAGHQLLAPGGCLAVITQNNLFTSLAGKEVRKYLQHQRCIRRIVDFGHNKVFQNASAYTCLFFSGTEESDEFEFETLSGDVNPTTLKGAKFSSIKLSSLNPEKWRLASGAHLPNLRMLESIGSPLGKIASIKVGFATLKDAVYLVREEGAECVANPWPGGSFPVEVAITRPAVKIADLNSVEDLKNNNRRIIFPYEKVNGRYKIIPEEKLRKNFPQAFSYLLQCRELLATRDKGKKVYDSWYAWGRTQGLEAPGPKLLTKTFSRVPRFILDESDQLFCNGYAVFMRERPLIGDDLPIEALGRILNSRVMHYYLKLTSFQIEGDYQCYQKNFIEKFGIVDMTEEQIERLLGIPEAEVDEYVAGLYGLRLKDMDQILNNQSIA